MQKENLLKQISFVKEIDKLKYIQRRTKLFNSERHENDAEHSWHLAMMAIVLAEHSDKPIDVLKVLKMVPIHYIVEIDAGDTFIYDTTKNHTNTEEERRAAQRIFGLLPMEQAKEFMQFGRNFKMELLRKQNLQKQWTGWDPCYKPPRTMAELGQNLMSHFKKCMIRKSQLKMVRKRFGVMLRICLTKA